MVLLEGEKHSVPKLTASDAVIVNNDPLSGLFGKDRISVNLFYSTKEDLEIGGVSVSGNLNPNIDRPPWLWAWRERQRRARGAVLSGHVVDAPGGDGGSGGETAREPSTMKKRRWKKGED